MLFICSKTPPIRALTQEKSDVITVKKKKEKVVIWESPLWSLIQRPKPHFPAMALSCPHVEFIFSFSVAPPDFQGFPDPGVFALCLCYDFSAIQHIIANKILLCTTGFSSLFRLIKCFDAAKYNKSTRQIMHLPYLFRENHSFKML